MVGTVEEKLLFLGKAKSHPGASPLHQYPFLQLNIQPQFLNMGFTHNFVPYTA